MQFLSVLFIALIIFNRLRSRTPLDLDTELGYIRELLLKCVATLIFVSIILNICKLLGFFSKESRFKFVQHIKDRICDIKVYFGLSPTISFYDQLLNAFFELIEKSERACTVFLFVFNLLIFKYPNPIKKYHYLTVDTCDPKRMKMLHKYSYWIFRFIPLVTVQSIGFYEIIVYHYVDFYYKSLFLLLIPFLFTLLIRQQLYHNYNNKWDFKAFHLNIRLCIDKNTKDGEELELYNLRGIRCIIPEDVDISYGTLGLITASEDKLALLEQFGFMILREQAAMALCILLKSFPKADIFCAILSLSFILGLLNIIPFK